MGGRHGAPARADALQPAMQAKPESSMKHRVILRSHDTQRFGQVLKQLGQGSLKDGRNLKHSKASWATWQGGASVLHAILAVPVCGDGFAASSGILMPCPHILTFRWLQPKDYSD